MDGPAEDGDEYAICGLESGTAFIDITDPRNPAYLGFLPATTGPSPWRDMKVFSNHVFIVADSAGSHGMQVFDLTRLRNVNPNNPQTFTRDALYTTVTSAHNIAINEDTGYAYLVGSNQANGGLHAVNINNPTNPTTAGNYSGDGYTHDVQVVTYTGPDGQYSGREIAFACNEDTLTIVDVTNKNNMTMISRNSYTGDQYTHQCWLTEDQRYVYLCDELDEGGGNTSRTHIFDIQDLNNVNYLGRYQGTTEAIDHNLYIKDNYIYLANYTAGLKVLEFDPNNPTDVTEVASIDTFGNGDAPSFNGAWSCYPYFPSGTILINDINGGMFLAKLSAVSFDFPNGRPTNIDPSGGIELQIDITASFGETIDPPTATLFLDRADGNGFQAYPLSHAGGDTYDVNFPSTTCGTTVQYYFSASTLTGTTVYSPSNAPSDVYEAFSVDDILTSFEDNFETNQGWSVSGNANDGQWNRGVPVGGGDRGDPASDADGSGQCYLTDNEDGNSDVDGGNTILTSPIFDGTADGALVSYYRWYSNDFGSDPNSDIFVVEISNNGGSSWTNLETVGPTGIETAGGWFYKEFLISDTITPTANMRVRFIAEDAGGGSVIEAGVDLFSVQSFSCDAEPVVIPPANVNIFRGLLLSGSGADLADSDDVRMVFNPGFVLNNAEAPVWLVFDANLPNDNPGVMSFAYESNSNTPGLTATLEAWNWNSGAFATVDATDETFNADSVVSVDLSAGISDYVLPGTGDVRTRLGWRKTGFTIIFPWEAKLDQAIWTAE